MTQHLDILDEREAIGRPLLGSLFLHGGILAAVLLYGLDSGGHAQFGDPSSQGGGGVSITPVSQIPLPTRGGLTNPVANPTESRVPQPPKVDPKTKKAEPEDPNAIALKAREEKKKLSDIAAAQQRYRARRQEMENQLYSSTGQTMSSRMYNISGSGGVGVGGTGNPFGARFGAYEQLLRERVGRNWRTDEVDPRLQTAPVVIITFEILRSGTVRNITFLQRSGNPTLDYSAMRAIQESSPFPELPAAFEHNLAKVEFWFQLKR